MQRRLDDEVLCLAADETYTKKRTKWCSTWLIIILRYLLFPLPCLALILPTFFSSPPQHHLFFMKKHIKIKFHGEHFNLKCNLSLTSSVVAKPVERCLIAFSAPRFFYMCCYQKFNVKFSISFSFYGLMDEWEMIFRFLLCVFSLARASRVAVETHSTARDWGEMR